MKNTLKKLIVPVVALSLLTTGSVFATAVETTDAELPVLINESTESDFHPIVNGAIVDNVPVVIENDVTLIPLRAVAEGLGYTVTWNEEDQSIIVTDYTKYVRLEIGNDIFRVRHWDPITLESAPILVNDCVTHVPVSFVDEILNGYYSKNEDGTYKIVIPSFTIVTEVTEDGILVDDAKLGDVLVKLDENTVVINSEGNPEDPSLIKDGMTLLIEYSPAMTMSIPAQSTAVKIIIEDLPVNMPELDAEVEVQPEEAVAFSGVITEIEDELVLVGNPEDEGAVRLVVTENTEIKHEMNRRLYRLEDLEVGMTISGTHSGAATFSIPPQSEAYSIVIGK